MMSSGSWPFTDGNSLCLLQERTLTVAWRDRRELLKKVRGLVL